MLTLAVTSRALHSGGRPLAWSSSEVLIIFVLVGVLVGFLGLVFVRCHMKPRRPTGPNSDSLNQGVSKPTDEQRSKWRNNARETLHKRPSQ